MTTPEEDELRRALESRSGAPSPEFRARLSQALGTRPTPTNLMPAVAIATVFALTVASVGVLVAARHFGRSANLSAPGAKSSLTGGFSFQLSAPSASVVWALYDPDKLYRSTDEGNTWQSRPMPKDFGVHPKISFISDQEGWWLSPGPPIFECQQGDAAIFHTSDGGATWQQLPGKGISPEQCKDGIWFFDSKHGCVTASDANNRPTVYRTSDGGATWAGATVQDPAYFKSAPGGFTLQVLWMKQFGGALYLMVHGVQDDPNLPHDNQFVLRSTDGGASWTLVTKVASRSVVMVTQSRWLDLQGGGQSMESTNGGQQFHPLQSNFFVDPASNAQIAFADSQVGYASGKGYLQRTQDGGVTWSRLAPPGLGNVAPTEAPSPPPGSIPMPGEARLSAPSPEVVWALVDGQYLFRSVDQGTTWRQEGLPAFDHFTDISFVDESDGWVFDGGPGASQCGSGSATVWRTADAGATWKQVANVDFASASAARTAGSIRLEQCKENLSFIDKQQGFLDAWDPNSAPTIYHTSDGGVTWSSSRLADPPGFKTYAGGDALRAGLVRSFGGILLVEAGGGQPDGFHSYVFESTDGGAAWSYLATTPGSASQVQVSFLTPTHWLKVQAGLETTDGGRTWHAFSYNDEEAAGVYSAFVFVDDKVGYATVRGDIRRTVDGGANFVLIKSTWP